MYNLKKGLQTLITEIKSFIIIPSEFDILSYQRFIRKLKQEFDTLATLEESYGDKDRLIRRVLVECLISTIKYEQAYIVWKREMGKNVDIATKDLEDQHEKIIIMHEDLIEGLQTIITRILGESQ